MKKISILYDFDGTLADTAYAYAEKSADTFLSISHQTAAAAKPNKDNLSAFLLKPHITGLSTKDKLLALKQEFGIDLIDLASYISQTLKPLKKSIYESDNITLSKNVETVLKQLQKLGFRQGIASTNTQHILDAAIMRFALKDIFKDAVYSSLEDEPKKPAPDLLIRAAHNIDAAPKHTIYLGDATTDMIAAKAAGMIAIAFYPQGLNDHEGIQVFQKAGSDYIIHDFIELPPILNALEEGLNKQPNLSKLKP